MEFLRNLSRKKVPLWALLLVCVFLILALFQIMADAKMHIEEHIHFVEKLCIYSNGAAVDLNNAAQNACDPQVVEPSLAGAYFKVTDLKELTSWSPQYTILGKEKQILSDTKGDLFIVIPYVQSQIRELRDNYGETYALSPSDLSQIQLLGTAFEKLFAALEEYPGVSHDQLADSIKAFCISVYPPYQR